MSLRCFKYAFHGIIDTARTEHNFRFMIGVFGMVISAGSVCGLSNTEWAAVLICCGLSLGMELVNTAVEAVVDLITKEKHPLAKKAKDAASAASLVICSFSAVVGFVIFIPYFIKLFCGW